MGDRRIKCGGIIFLDLDYADDLRILHESVCKMNELLEVLRVQIARIGLKIKVKKTKLQRIGVNENEKVTLGKQLHLPWLHY